MLCNVRPYDGGSNSWKCMFLNSAVARFNLMFKVLQKNFRTLLQQQLLLSSHPTRSLSVLPKIKRPTTLASCTCHLHGCSTKRENNISTSQYTECLCVLSTVCLQLISIEIFDGKSFVNFCPRNQSSSQNICPICILAKTAFCIMFNFPLCRSMAEGAVG